MSRNTTITPSRTNSTLPTTSEAGFGSFVYFCRDTPSVPWCNLFYKQLSRKNFRLPDSATSPVGIDPLCGIERAGNGGSPAGNIANILACIISAGIVLYLTQRVNRRRAAVGRIELRATLVVYIVTCLLQLVTLGSFLEQGSLPLVVVTALHAGSVVLFFWMLVANAFIATQVVEDGTPSSLIPFYGLGGIFFLATTYVSVDTALGFTGVFQSDPPRNLSNIGLFVLLELWPAVAALVFFGVMLYVCIGVLQEWKPAYYYIGAFLAFAASQVVYLVASRPLCELSNRMVDGSFIATLLETAAVGFVFVAWMTITEGSWDQQYFLA